MNDIAIPTLAASAQAIKPSSSFLRMEDGISIHVQDWVADSHPPDAGQRSVVILHGLGEHCGRYAHVARYFNSLGWSVRTYDHRGHGQSDGARGDVPGHDTLLWDAKAVFDDFARHFDTAPLLLGHSMGGLFAARFAVAAMSPASGLVLSSPALGIPLSSLQRLLLKTLGTAAPGLGVPNGLDAKYLSHDTAVVDAYCRDPLVHRKITPRLLQAMLDAGSFCHMHAHTLTIPSLLLVAGSDRMVDPSGSDRFFSRLPAGAATIRRYPDLYHELFNEIGATEVFRDLGEWLVELDHY